MTRNHDRHHPGIMIGFAGIRSLSDYGQLLVARNGVVAVDTKWEKTALVDGPPAEFKSLAESASRFSLTFRFGGDALEPKSERDLNRFVNFVHSPAGANYQEILVVGFAGAPKPDPGSKNSDESSSCRSSLEAAKTVADSLQMKKLANPKIVGFGDRFPILNLTPYNRDEGDARNKRVEIWMLPSGTNYSGPWPCQSQSGSDRSLLGPQLKIKASGIIPK